MLLLVHLHIIVLLFAKVPPSKCSVGKVLLYTVIAKSKLIVRLEINQQNCKYLIHYNYYHLSHSRVATYTAHTGSHSFHSIYRLLKLASTGVNNCKSHKETSKPILTEIIELKTKF